MLNSFEAEVVLAQLKVMYRLLNPTEDEEKAFNELADDLYHKDMEKLKIDIGAIKAGTWVYVDQDENGVYINDLKNGIYEELPDYNKPAEYYFELEG